VFVQEIQNGFEAALASRTPFVVRGAASDWPGCAWDVKKFENVIGHDENDQYWHHLPESHSFSADLPCPSWLSDYWCSCETRLSLERPIRIWQSHKGDQTPWHYDGNALDVINVQLNGAKHFSLIPPDSELPWLRFLPISTLGYQPACVPTLELTLNGGDLIFIPRFWSHQVRALDDTNHNINWVWTDSAFTPSSAVAVREAERLAAIKLLEDSGRLESLVTPQEVDSLQRELRNYGGSQNASILSQMFETVTPERINARIEIELAGEPIEALLYRLDDRGRSLVARDIYGNSGRLGDALVDA
jgi:hypothetical protein